MYITEKIGRACNARQTKITETFESCHNKFYYQVSVSITRNETLANETFDEITNHSYLQMYFFLAL